MSANPSVGVWLVGAGGTLATTAIVGARAIVNGLAGRTALVSDAPEFASLGLPDLPQLVFGGHDIRPVALAEAARLIGHENGSIRSEWIDRLGDELAAIDREIRPGQARGGGGAIEAIADPTHLVPSETGRTCIETLASHLRDFRNRRGLSALVVVNVASTEPPPTNPEVMSDLDRLDRALDQLPASAFRPGVLYAYAAMASGAAFINFTASPSCLCGAIEELAARRGLPYMGNDGKTGETLVKSGLAPMFRARQLEVMSWVGYNILGNRDGQVLAEGENKSSKIATKDSVLASILGQPVRTRVGIDYVESLGDSKVAWDYIHFRGFLGHPMAMQFTWQGCDSILAAPLVLDLARFAAGALARGESGPMTQLASFFKNPMHAHEHDLYRQLARLHDYTAARQSKPARNP